MLRAVRALVSALALALLAGCGAESPPPEDQVRATVAAFGEATAAKDYQRLCDDILAPALVEDVERVGLPCEVALRQGLDEVRDPRLTVGGVRVQGDRATARVRTAAAGQEPSEDSLRLERVEGSWRVASLGS
jgi:predicted small lipoprotein YifL